jgi:hypothetical protein
MWMSAIGTKRTLRERDGYGALQIFDQAAKLMRTGYRPTALIVAITRADLLKARTWRMTIIRGNSQEVFTSIKPSLEVNPKNTCTDNSH